MLAIARHPFARGASGAGDDRRAVFANAPEAGANFVPFDAQVDFDHRHLEEQSPGARRAAAGYADGAGAGVISSPHRSPLLDR